MDDLVRRKDLLEVMANCTSSWGQGLDKELRRDWALGVKIKDNFLREIEKLEAVPVASKEVLVKALDTMKELDMMMDDDWYTNEEIAEYILNNCALFATNHLPLEIKARSDCSTLEYCKGWNDAVKQMAASHMQAMPCKVGDKLWVDIGEDEVGVDAMEVQSVSFCKAGCVIGLSCGTLYREITPEDIGKTAFWSDEEALAALDDDLKVVEDVLEAAATKCEEVNKGGQYKAGSALDRDPLVWGGADAAGCVEDEYEFY